MWFHRERVAQKWVLNTLMLVLLIICQKFCVKVSAGGWYYGLFLGRVVVAHCLQVSNQQQQQQQQHAKPPKLMHAMLERPNQR